MSPLHGRQTLGAVWLSRRGAPHAPSPSIFGHDVAPRRASSPGPHVLPRHQTRCAPLPMPSRFLLAPGRAALHQPRVTAKDQSRTGPGRLRASESDCNSSSHTLGLSVGLTTSGPAGAGRRARLRPSSNPPPARAPVPPLGARPAPRCPEPRGRQQSCGVGGRAVVLAGPARPLSAPPALLPCPRRHPASAAEWVEASLYPSLRALPPSSSLRVAPSPPLPHPPPPPHCPPLFSSPSLQVPTLPSPALTGPAWPLTALPVPQLGARAAEWVVDSLSPSRPVQPRPSLPPSRPLPPSLPSPISLLPTLPPSLLPSPRAARRRAVWLPPAAAPPSPRAHTRIGA